MIFYLDSSALLKRYKTEIGTDVVDRLYASKEDLLTSQYACVEVASVAIRALRGRVIDREAYEKLMGAFVQDIKERLLPWPVSTELVDEAFVTVTKYGLRAGDGLHMTSAEGLRTLADKGEEFFFVASDRELLNASRSAGMHALDPEASDSMDVLVKRGL